MNMYSQHTRNTLALWVALLTNGLLFAQYEVVEFDYSNAYFNNGQALPAESKLIFSGEVDRDIQLVEMEVYKGGTHDKRAALYLSNWKRGPQDNAQVFRVPLNHKLKGNTAYDFVFTFFRKPSANERREAEKLLHQALDDYLTQYVLLQNGNYQLRKSKGSMIRDMNEVVDDALSAYVSSQLIDFEGFSDVVKDALGRLDDQAKGVSVEGKQEMLKALKQLAYRELDEVLGSGLLLREDVRKVIHYSTEKTQNALAINVGYGGVFLGGDIEKANYDAAPYIGISLPLGDRSYASTFWSNLSVSMGVFTQNFEDVDGNTLTGPIFGRPYFLGVGYNFFRFVRVNAGVTALEREGTSTSGNGGVGLDVSEINLRPFVGLSAEFDLWLGLRERK